MKTIIRSCFLGLIALTLFSLIASAQPQYTGEARARQLALDFLMEKGITGSSATRGGATLQLLYTDQGAPKGTRSSRSGNNDSLALWYLFGAETPNGSGAFVLINGLSGNGADRPILAYGTNGTFDPSKAPEHLLAWLNVYTEANRQALAKSSTPRSSKRTTRRTTPVEPLLGEIAWDQLEPYNTFTPKDGNGTPMPTGCVATAIGQIMRYYAWPKRAKQTLIEYTPKGFVYEIRQVIGAKDYDWESMPGMVSAQSPIGEREAIARLLYDIGVASQMNYRSAENGGSGTFSFMGGQALLKYFDYAPSLQNPLRIFYSRDEWEALIESELQAKRPVYYAGSGLQGGHAFVLDGHDGNGYYHFNWGWSGMGNGYFSLSDLSPSSLGAGGGSGGFTSKQEILIGIEPRSTKRYQPLTPCFRLTELKPVQQRIQKKDDLDVEIHWFISQTLQEGLTVGLALGIFDGNNQLVEHFPVGRITQLKMNTGLTHESIIKAGVQPRVNFSKHPDGNYRVEAIYQLLDDQNRTDGTWYRAKMYRTLPGPILAEVKNNDVTLSNMQGDALDIEIELLSNELPINTPIMLPLRMTNHGPADYGSIFEVRALRNGRIAQRLHQNSLYIAEGETKTLDLVVTLTEAADAIEIVLDPRNNTNILLGTDKVDLSSTPGQRFPITLLPKENLGESATITISNQPRSVKQLQDLTFDITLSLDGPGDAYRAEIYYVLKNDTGNVHSPTSIVPLAVATRNAPFRKNVRIEMGPFAPGKYTLWLIPAYPKSSKALTRFKGKNAFNFTIVEDPNLRRTGWNPAGTEKAHPFNVLPNPFYDILTIRTDQSTLPTAQEGAYRLELATPTGIIALQTAWQPNLQPELQLNTSTLAPGIYLLTVRNEQGETIAILRVIKATH